MDKKQQKQEDLQKIVNKKDLLVYQFISRSICGPIYQKIGSIPNLILLSSIFSIEAILDTTAMTLDDLFQSDLQQQILCIQIAASSMLKLLLLHYYIKLVPKYCYFNTQQQIMNSLQTSFSDISQQKGSQTKLNTTQNPPFKKYCCGAIKRLKQKCLRFNDNSEIICKQFIEGHQQCRQVKKYYQSIWNGLEAV